MARRFFVFLTLVILGACSSATSAPPMMTPVTNAGAAFADRTSPIKHVIVVVQEKRSFDDLFCRFPGADGATLGLMHTGKSIALAPTSLADPIPVVDDTATFVTEYADAKMDGFDLAPLQNGKPAGRLPYACVKPSAIKPYWNLARTYTLADHTFSTATAGDFVAHQELISGTNEVRPNTFVIGNPNGLPWGCDAPAGTTVPTTGGRIRPCFAYPTLANLLDARGLWWKYYVPPFAPPSVADRGGELWNAFDAVKRVRYGKDWARDVGVPNTTFFADVRKGALPPVSWVIPAYADSDDPSSGRDGGPHWVASVVDAIKKSPYWSSTAIVIVWDDSGGLYDHVPPPVLDSQGLGFRVPMIVVSPYAKRGFVSHTQYEFGSILKFIEANWNLGSLGTTDVRANSIADCFDFTQPPQRR